MTLAGAVAGQALVVATLAAASWAAGRLALRALRIADETAPASIVLAVGLLSLAQGALLLGLLGVLRGPLVGIVAAAGSVAAAWDLRRQPPSRAAIAVAALVAVIAVPGALLTLYPALGFDQTLYHLPMARAFAGTGGVPMLPALRYPVFPALGEVLNAAVLTLGSDVTTQIAGWLALVVTLGLAHRWAGEASTPEGAWIAVAIVAGCPIAWYLASTGYVEPLLAMAGTAAGYAALRSRGESGTGWLMLAGALAGSAAGVKYLGLYFVPAVVVAACVGVPRSVAWRRLVVCSVAAIAAMAPSYGRLIAHTGNPLFPFYPALFGESPWAAQEFLGARGTARVAAALLALWNGAFHPERIGGLPAFSPAIALGLPLVVLALRRRPSIGVVAAIAGGFLLLSPIHAHYLLTIAPLLAVAIGSAAGVLAGASRLGRAAVIVTALAILAQGERFAIDRMRGLGAPPLTVAERERLLTTQRPVHAAVAFLNRLAPGVPVYAVGAENLVDDRVGPLLGDHNGPHSHTRMQIRVEALGGVAAALDEIGAAFLLVREDGSIWAGWGRVDPRLVRVYGDAHASVYRVIPAAPAAPDIGARPRPD